MSPGFYFLLFFPLAIHTTVFLFINFLCEREKGFVITHFTFHNLQNKLYFPMFHTLSTYKNCSHDENIKKIARKIQIHDAKRYVLLDKTFFAKKKCVQYLLFITLLCFFCNPSSTFSSFSSSYVITFYYYCCRASIHNF
jgi:hypothetical protein